MTIEEVIERICVLEEKVAVLEAKLSGICFDPITPVAFKPEFRQYRQTEMNPHTKLVEMNS